MADPIINPTTHVYDETGELADNYIENERRDPGTGTYRAIFARFGAFYAKSLIVRDGNGNIVTTDKYKEALPNPIISAKVAKDVIGAIVIEDSTIPGPFFIDYQCVGGPWAASNEHIIELYKQLMTDTRPVRWPDIIGKDDVFKPAPHFQDIGDLYGAEYFVAILERLGNAILMGDNASHDEIFRMIDTLRTDTEARLDDLERRLRLYIDQQDVILAQRISQLDARLTQVNNQLAASIAATNANLASTASNLQSGINGVNSALSSHIGDKNNPHATTFSQTGALSYSDGLVLTRSITQHAGSFENPHKTNYTQVGTLSATTINAMISTTVAHVNDLNAATNARIDELESRSSS